MIVIPMVGRSRRFLEAGYAVPKYRLELCGWSVFALAVGSFREVARSRPLLIICLAEDRAADFIRAELAKLGIADYRIAELPAMTSGQADTVSQGLRAASVPDAEPVTIFNIDTFRPGFRFPEAFDSARVDGYLECFIGNGPNWSNVVPAAPGLDRAIRTSEKMQESEYCCTGLYHFASRSRFDAALAAESRLRAGGAAGPGETYVAPIYNHLIAGGGDVRFTVVAADDVIFCGVPAEYEGLRTRPGTKFENYATSLHSRTGTPGAVDAACGASQKPT